MSRAYYNENDEFAAAWLRNCIASGLVAPGEVDARSIVDVRADDLRGFEQCHFFAGIGVWSYSMRLAGWPDDRHGWTGSCPCGPFSGAGAKSGFDDERHLWPEFFRLIRECRPRIVFGEQVASPLGLAWFDLVQSDLEGEAYASAALDLCAAGFGAPHIRQRLYWMAYAASSGGWTGLRDHGSAELWRPQSADLGATRILVDGIGSRLEGYAGHGDGAAGREIEDRSAPATGAARTMDDAERDGRRARWHDNGRHERLVIDATGINAPPGPVNSLWRDADWLLCRDGKWRPVEPGTFPLAHGAPARVGRLRGYGNAIVAQVAAEFIKAAIEVLP
jgi:DNA (cytosine-5)-methyltransferase 1